MCDWLPSHDEESSDERDKRLANQYSYGGVAERTGAMTQEGRQKSWFAKLFNWIWTHLIGRLAIWTSTLAISVLLLANRAYLAIPLPIFVALATEIRSWQVRRARAEAQEQAVERRLAIRQGTLARKFRSAFDPSERVDFNLVKDAIDLCDDGKFESAIELLADSFHPDAMNLDYAALYVRGFAHFNLGARRQAEEDFQMSLACLKSERGIVESALAALYISKRQWEDGLAAADRSIEALKLSARARRWIPYAYKAAIHEMNNDVNAAQQVLIEMGPLVQDNLEARRFLENHPFLEDTVKSAAFKEAFQIDRVSDQHATGQKGAPRNRDARAAG